MNSNEDVVKVTRVVSAEATGFEEQEGLQQNALRPKKFADYPGQERTRANLEVYVAAALQRGGAMDHMILHGPSGLGKTTLANIVANELGTQLISTSGPTLDKPGDLAGILAGVEKNSVLFIDEIHRLPIQVEEMLYSAMEDYALDILVGQGTSAKTIRMPLEPFCLIGATTKLSKLSRPFLSRFGIQEKMEYYSHEALRVIITRSAYVMGISIANDAALELAKCSRGTPRIANRLLKRVWDFAAIWNESFIDLATVQKSLQRLNIDAQGLDKLDREILLAIHSRFGAGPVGIDNLATTLGEDRRTIEDVYEPYLVHRGFVVRGARGRSLTELACRLISEKRIVEEIFDKIEGIDTRPYPN